MSEHGVDQRNSFLRSLVYRIGNPLEWGYVDKALLLIVFQLLVYGALVLYVYLAHRFPSLYPAYETYISKAFSCKKAEAT